MNTNPPCLKMSAAVSPSLELGIQAAALHGLGLVVVLRGQEGIQDRSAAHSRGRTLTRLETSWLPVVSLVPSLPNKHVGPTSLLL